MNNGLDARALLLYLGSKIGRNFKVDCEANMDIKQFTDIGREESGYKYQQCHDFAMDHLQEIESASHISTEDL